jgi:peptide/nickel transport system substrate-binding protein
MTKTLILAFACAAAWPAAALAQSGSKITIAENFPPRAGFALETDDANVLSKAGCLEPLTRIDFDSKLQPSLAESWTQVSPDVWDFKLRKGVTFQDGKPLTAAAAAASLNAVLRVPTPARAFSPRVIKSVEAVGEDTVRVTTPSPSVLTPLRLAAANAGILSPAAYKEGKIDPVGTCTGPFVITRVNGQQSLSLKRNDSYWGGKVALAEAEIKFIPDANVRATQLRTGEADVAGAVPASTLAALKKTSGVKVVTLATPRTTTLLINTKKPPFDNEKVRQALQLALDLEGIAGSVYEGSVQPAIGPFAPHEPWVQKAAKPASYDVKKAQALLAEAGVKPGSLELEIMAYSEKIEFKDLAAILQDQFKAVGINARIRLAEYKALEPDMIAGRYDVALLSRSHLVDVADPAGFLQSDYGCGGGFNLSQHCDKDFDAKLAMATAEADSGKRYAVYADLAQHLQSKAVNVFVIHEAGNDGYKTRVRNYRIHPLYQYTLTRDLAVD